MANYLVHHGIKGQSWGVQNGPPYPLDKSISNGRKLYKQIKRSHKRNDGNQPRVSKDTINLVANIVTEQDISDLNSKRRAYYDYITSDEYRNNTDYWESTQRNDDYAKAYDDTLKWFKENEPSYLDGITKEYPDVDDYSDFHDFRKMLEGYESHYYEIGEKKYYNDHPESSKIKKKSDKLFGDYYNATKACSEKILGKYSDKKVGYSFGRSRDAKSFVSGALETLAEFPAMGGFDLPPATRRYDTIIKQGR